MTNASQTIYDYSQRIIINKLLATEALHHAESKGLDEIDVMQYQQGESQPVKMRIRKPALQRIAYTNSELSSVAKDAKQALKDKTKGKDND